MDDLGEVWRADGEELRARIEPCRPTLRAGEPSCRQPSARRVTVIEHDRRATRCRKRLRGHEPGQAGTDDQYGRDLCTLEHLRSQSAQEHCRFGGFRGQVAETPEDTRRGSPQSTGGTDWDLSKFAIISGLMTPSASSRDMPALPYTALLRA